MLRKSLAELDRRRKNPDENQKGFTLIELLVVIIIIGILAAIAIPVFLNQRQSAWQASVASDLKNAAVVVETFGTAHNGSYASLTDLTASNNAGAITPAATSFKVSDGNTITVVLSAAGTSYTITGTNTNIAKGAQIYDSTLGGLQKWVQN